MAGLLAALLPAQPTVGHSPLPLSAEELAALTSGPAIRPPALQVSTEVAPRHPLGSAAAAAGVRTLAVDAGRQSLVQASTSIQMHLTIRTATPAGVTSVTAPFSLRQDF